MDCLERNDPWIPPTCVGELKLRPALTFAGLTNGSPYTMGEGNFADERGAEMNQLFHLLRDGFPRRSCYDLLAFDSRNLAGADVGIGMLATGYPLVADLSG